MLYNIFFSLVVLLSWSLRRRGITCEEWGSGACVDILYFPDPVDPWNPFSPTYIYVYMVWINKALFNCISQCAPESVLPALTVIVKILCCN